MERSGYVIPHQHCISCGVARCAKHGLGTRRFAGYYFFNYDGNKDLQKL
jgi:hypothetical protein